MSVYHGGVSKQAPCDADRGTTVLSRLKVTGFKNLLDVDVAFGPFTCIAGPNGVGKTTSAREFLPRYVECLVFVGRGEVY